MKHTSRLFGTFSYNPNQVLTFPNGLLGFEEYTKFVVKVHPDTSPVMWLLSVEENGPELALIDPNLVSAEFSLDDIRIDRKAMKLLQAGDAAKVRRYAVVTLPDNIKRMSMNLRSPILIDPMSKRGLEYCNESLEKKPVRCYIYRDLISSRPEDKQGTLLMHRKLNETIEIGDEITLQVLEFLNGGVRFSISAPKTMRVCRGSGKVTPECETIRASERMDFRRLEGIMKMHQVMQGKGPVMKDAVKPMDRQNINAG